VQDSLNHVVSTLQNSIDQVQVAQMTAASTTYETDHTSEGSVEDSNNAYNAGSNACYETGESNHNLGRNLTPKLQSAVSTALENAPGNAQMIANSLDELSAHLSTLTATIPPDSSVEYVGSKATDLTNLVTNQIAFLIQNRIGYIG
jgi:hypothetical protein